MSDTMTDRITASEAVFGFAAWLTMHKQIVSFGANVDCAPAAELAGKWIKENNLPDPREGVYPHNITQPKE